MLKTVLHNYGFGLNYAKMLVEGIDDDQMAQQPTGIVNHPAWTLGHLVIASDFGLMLLGGQPVSPKTWSELFGRKTIPVDDRAKYPSKVELIEALENRHTQVTELAGQADPDLFAKPIPNNEEFRQFMPTIGDGLVYLMVAHEATHLGQISAWRRSLGLPSVMG